MEEDEYRKAPKKAKRPNKISKIRKDPEPEKDEDDASEDVESFQQKLAPPLSPTMKNISQSVPIRIPSERKYKSETLRPQPQQQVPSSLSSAKEALEQLTHDYEQIEVPEMNLFDDIEQTLQMNTKVPRPPPIPKALNNNLKAVQRPQQYQTKGPIRQREYQYQEQENPFPPYFPESNVDSFRPELLPPITTVENITDLFQETLGTSSIEKFREHFNTKSASIGIIRFNANSLATDAHIYQLIDIDLPLLYVFDVRACANVTPFAKNYIQTIRDKHTENISVNFELIHQSMNDMIENSTLNNDILQQLESLFGPPMKTYVSKVLIYHANDKTDAFLPSQHLIINHLRKTKESVSPMILDYSLTTQNDCQTALLECSHPILFHELYKSFHPQMIYVVVSSIDEILKYFFSFDASSSYAMLTHQEIRFILSKTDPDGKFLTTLHSRLSEISQTAENLYKIFLDDQSQIDSENDDFRRNNYLSSLLRLRSKCQMFQKKITKDSFLVWNQDTTSFFNRLMNEAAKYSKPVHHFSPLSNINDESNRVKKNDTAFTVLAEDITRQAVKIKAETIAESSIKIAHALFSHQRLCDKILNFHSTANGKSFYVSDIDWFCRSMNNLFQTQLTTNRRTERIIEQLKQTIGSDVRLITKWNLKSLNIAPYELDFVYWLFNTWNIAYPVTIDDQTDNRMYVLFNSISAEPTVPLETVWPTSWPNDQHQSIVYFHLLHPCDSTILYDLYRLFPSQKILLATKDFLIIRDGAMEVLLRYHHLNGQTTDLSITCRSLNLSTSDMKTAHILEFHTESFQYLVEVYHVIIWAFLVKNDYAFKIERMGSDKSKSCEEMNGNALMMNDRWKHLALYHYSHVPTLTSPCTVCGLSPSANKALYDACTILCPERRSCRKSRDAPPQLTETEETSGTFMFELGKNQLNYTDKHVLRPDGFNSFDVICLSKTKTGLPPTDRFLALLRVGCLVNNFDTEENEMILFEYGFHHKGPIKRNLTVKQNEVSKQSFLDEIQQFGGVEGLKSKSKQAHEKKVPQELYPGLQLRIDILNTYKTNTFEIVFSVNGTPWSTQTVKRKSTQTVFQPIVQSHRTDNSEQNLFLVVHHRRTLLDDATVVEPQGTHLKNPWKVGMRLEAKDRKNPNILAIANIIEVYEDNRIRINFDGWTSNFDYTAERDHPDLHPCGYWEYIQRVFYKNVNTSRATPHSTFSRYDKPKSYDRAFSWRNYLAEKNFDPVPFECFNYMQTEGMTSSYFPHGLSRTAFATRSCRYLYNPRVRYQKMNTFIQDEIVSKILCEHTVIGVGAPAKLSPGAILLPTPIDINTIQYPSLKYFLSSSNIMTIHLTCNHRDAAPWDQSTIVSGSHLLDSDGEKIQKEDLQMSIINLCMLTALDLARKQKHAIAPCTSKLISNQTKSTDKNLIEFYIRRWLELSAYIMCFHSTDFFNRRLATKLNTTHIQLYTSFNDPDLHITLKKNLDSVPLQITDANDSRQEKTFGNHGECFYCSLLRKDVMSRQTLIPISRRLEIIDAYAPCIFYVELHEADKDQNPRLLTFNDQFFTRFHGIEIIDVKNIVIDPFQLESKNNWTLKNLTYLSLENNDLTKIDVDFHRLNRLSHLRLIHNPLVSLPANIFSSKALQHVELNELGRLTDLDPNMRFSSELRTMLMTDSILTQLPAALGVDTRTKLTKLTLSGPSWWRPEGMSVNEVVKYDSFKKKFVSFLNEDDLGLIYRMYDEDSNGILSFSEINLMNAHIYQYIPRLRPLGPKLPNSGRSSTEPGATTTAESDLLKQDSLTLDPSGVPSAIFGLENLVELTLDYQGIKIVPDAIKNLKSLNILNLNYCIELETISAHVGFLPLKELNLTGCISLKTPPIEIIRRGHTKIMAFLQRLISGSTACKRTKLMLVGLGGAGKTSLVRAFLQSYSTAPPAVTDGIDILKWKVPLEQKGDVLEFSVWDFAGQSVYYHTHQFFLAKKAVYVLAWNIRLGAEHAGLDFWLSSICCHAPNAPIFVVGTHSDQVSRIDLRQDDLKRRYPQIAGFFNVSTLKGDNVDDLIENIIKTTLALPYMDEQIPKVWLSFEHLIGQCNTDILEYRQVEEIAHNAGIFDPNEVLQAVQFLHDLGSLQYFSSEHLKNYVVINPQWIVNVMACIVSIKDSPVKDGRLHHSDIDVIWKDYAEPLHPWILKLTEAFDLTFPVPDQNMNLVPCLLPEEEPAFTWEDVTAESEMKEMKVIYTFNYLPAGLFNRAQVRLFQFSDKSTIWRYGSLLVKNNHRAVVIRTDDRHIVVKIQGIRPDNILFLIHEVFENLVNESFFGVTYDIAFPCPDCLESRTVEPWQFSSSLINRAIELKSPSIQCHRFFHVASVTDLQALVPPDSKSNYDLHLEYSVRDLKTYRQNIAVDLIYLYPHEHIPNAREIELKVDPRKIKEYLTKRGLKVWTPESMQEFRIENHYLVIKAASVVVFGVSTELVENPENENLRVAFQTIKDILRKQIIPVLFGTNKDWQKSEIGVALSDALYVNMQDPKRYDNRVKDLYETIEQSRAGDKQNQQLRNQPTDVFISYCWLNSHDAAHKGTKTTAASLGWGDPRALKDYLEGRGLSVWMDITRLGKSGVIQDIVHGLKNTKLVIACVSNEYTQSEICRSEFLFAKNTLRLPMILAIFGNGDEWRMTEVGMCGLTCQQVNFQYENPNAFETVYSHISTQLPKRPMSAKMTAAEVATKPGVEQKTTAAYQELFELTQRKFLRLTGGFAEAMNTRPYPRLFTLDFIAKGENSAQQMARIDLAAAMTQEKGDASTAKEREEREEKIDKEDKGEENVHEEVKRQDSEEQSGPKKEEKTLGIRVLCENEENWHPAGNPFEITEKVVLQNSAPYLSRVMLLLKQSDLALEIITSDAGEEELHKLSELATSANIEVKESYAYLRRCVMDCDPEEKYCGLKQCLMPSGKVLWLCEEHQRQPRVVLVTGAVGSGYSRPQAEEKSDIIKALARLNERIANNELPPPVLRVPQLNNGPRLSVGTQDRSSRRRTNRRTRLERTMSKVDDVNASKIDETLADDDLDSLAADMAETSDEPTTQEELVTKSGDCSIM